MKTKMVRFVMLIAMLFNALTPATQAVAQTESASSKGVSPAGMLNPDGTLNLSGDFNGALDLAGYSVQMDPKRGPVFDPERSGNNAPTSAVASGNWAALGDGAGNFNNQINDIAISGTDVYVVGTFTDVANIPAADYVAKWNGTSWSALGANGAGDGALNGQVTAVATSGTDVYVGGYFDKVYNGASQVSGAAYIAKWDGSNWSALGNGGAGIPSLNGPASDIVVSGTDVYAGGWFTNVKDGVTTLNEADYVAKWNTASSHWSALGNGGAGIGSLNNGVNALAVNGANVYVGGYFTDVKDGATPLTEADYVAKWDGTNWSALGNNGASNGSLSSSVFTLAINGTDLYVGGGFNNVKNGSTTVTGSARIARWDGANWNALGNPLFNNEVRSLTVDASGNIYAGGIFTNVNNAGTPLPEADYVAKFDGTNWSAVGNDGAGNGSIPDKASPYTAVKALAMQGTTLFVGGYFFDVNDGSTVQPQADHLASWSGTNWSSVGTNVNGTFFDPTNPINAIAVIGTDVYVGGRFADISNHGINLPEADYVVKWDGTDWSALGNNGAGNGALNGEVSALAVSGTDLYVGGWFSYLNNGDTYLPAAQYIAKWDGTNWSALGSTAVLNHAVFSIAVDGSANVYAGGSFTDAASIPEADYIAKWDGANWSALGNSGAGVGALNFYVNALGVNGSNVYAGGYFTNAATIPEADGVAKWDGANWSALGSNGAVDGALSGSIYALAVSGSTVYVGGTFTDVNNNGTILTAADYIAKWDALSGNWSALGSGTAGNGAINSAVFAIAVSGTDVFAGGNFTNSDNKGTLIPEADYIAKWDGTDWSALGGNGAANGALNKNVSALTVNGTDLLVGGHFGDVNNSGTVIEQADRLAVWGIVPYVPVTLTVTKLADTADGVCDADCSLREAIGAAKTGDTIIFAAGLSGTIALGTTLIVDKSITITGPGASTLSISGSDAVRVFQIESGKTVSISNLTISHGYATGANGGGIYNAGMLTITNSQITTNTASLLGGGIYNAPGASLSLADTVVDHNMAYGDGGGLSLTNPGADTTPYTNSLNRVSVTDNVASGSGGGGISLSASASIINSLIANNSVPALTGAGGGIKLYESGAGFMPITVSVTNVTVSGNTAFGHGGGVSVSLQQAADSVTFNNVTIANNHRNMIPGPPAINGGGGIFAAGPEKMDLKNTIIAGNTTVVGGADCEGTINSLDYNLIQSTTNCMVSGTTTHNVTGVSANLDVLADNGGATLTMKLLAGSPAIDAANDATCASTDQRGMARPNGAHCDIGAHEADAIAPTVTMTSLASDPTNASPILATVQFSETVTGFTSDDIVPANGAVSNFAAVDGDTYTFDLTPSAQGPVTANIAAGVASDLAGNGSTAATQFSRTYDTIAPTVTMISAANNPTNTSPIAVTVQFSETVTGFVAGDILPSNGTVSNFVAVDDVTYTFDLIPSAQGPVTADIAADAATDSTGNGNMAATQFSRIYTVTYKLFLPLILR